MKINDAEYAFKNEEMIFTGIVINVRIEYLEVFSWTKKLKRNLTFSGQRLMIECHR